MKLLEEKDISGAGEMAERLITNRSFLQRTQVKSQYPHGLTTVFTLDPGIQHPLLSSTGIKQECGAHKHMQSKHSYK